MAAEDICSEYASSLEDLTFNSKPLINVLTMLAEENSQHAAEIIKLIEKRIYEVTIDKKLPSLYLMDSIVKNIGKEYITAVSPCIVALFTHVFEQADEKIRMSMFKLRNTWPPVFPAKTLHELDCSVHKRDPGWPVVEPPPPSPSIHINPKFLSKVDENEESVTSCSSSDEAKIVEEFERKKKELNKLQGEEMRLQMMQLEELQMKYDLIKKKQEKDRQNLLKQQKEQLLKMRLEQEVDSAGEDTTDSKLSDNSTAVQQIIKDPRLKKLEQVTGSKTESETSSDNSNNVPEKAKEETSTVKMDSVVEKPAEKVGFDLEFVPLNKDDDNVNVAPALAYNRDRPLGKNRYFRKDPKAKIMKSDSDSGSDFSENKDLRKDAQESNRRGRRFRGSGHHDVRQRHEHAKENKERKRNDRERGRRRQPGDRQGETTGDRTGYDLADGRNHRRHGDYPDVMDRPGDHLDWPGGDHPADRPGIRDRPVDRPGDRHGRRYNEQSSRPGNSHRGRHRGRLGPDIRPRHPSRREHDESMRDGRHRDEWSRGRGQRRPHRGNMSEGPIEGRIRPPQPVDNTGRLPERRDQGFDRPDGVPFERGFGDEPPYKMSRSSPPRPLFTEREISEIRERRRDSPDHPLEEWHNEPGFHESWRHGDNRNPPPEFFQGPHSGPRPRFPPHRGPPFASRGMPNEFLPPHFPGDIEIPMELTLDNESEILRSAEHRLRTGDLSEEQHRDLLEKLGQLYELQKWQRRRSIDMQARHEPGHPSFTPIISDMSNDQVPERTVLGEADVFSNQAPVDMTGDYREHNSQPTDPLLPRNPESNVFLSQSDKTELDDAPPSNLVMEKQTVDDLFRRLMDTGIITKVNQGLSPARAMTPPVGEIQILQENPVPQIPKLPEIKLTLDHLRRRYDGVIMELHRGNQCSTCGLRFKEANNEKYGQHLDWHFRMNRKEKETVAAHRSWFITTEDWLEFESSEDPKLKARSAVFEAESEGESEKSEDLQEGSCPVLSDDTESERQCDICLEKFETYWDETSEDWHYKNAVRVDGKTYHYLCYQDTNEAEDSDMEASDEKENNEDKDVDQNTSENNEAVAIENNDDKPSIVTKDTTVESEVVSVVQESDEVALTNTNKEEIKNESS